MWILTGQNESERAKQEKKQQTQTHRNIEKPIKRQTWKKNLSKWNSAGATVMEMQHALVVAVASAAAAACFAR